jgi:hypothetical protein
MQAFPDASIPFVDHHFYLSLSLLSLERLGYTQADLKSILLLA